MSTPKPRRANRWPALKRRIAIDHPDIPGGIFGFNVWEARDKDLTYARAAILRLTRWGCKVTLPRS